MGLLPVHVPSVVFSVWPTTGVRSSIAGGSTFAGTSATISWVGSDCAAAFVTVFVAVTPTRRRVPTSASVRT
jgi:hypothetical protein